PSARTGSWPGKSAWSRPVPRLRAERDLATPSLTATAPAHTKRPCRPARGWGTCSWWRCAAPPGTAHPPPPPPGTVLRLGGAAGAALAQSASAGGAGGGSPLRGGARPRHQEQPAPSLLLGIECAVFAGSLGCRGPRVGVPDFDEDTRVVAGQPQADGCLLLARR